MADNEFCIREIISFFSLFHRLHYHILNEESQCLNVDSNEVSCLERVVDWLSRPALIRCARLQYQFLMSIVAFHFGPRL